MADEEQDDEFLRPVEEEPIFLRYDEIADEIAASFANLIARMFRLASDGLSEARLGAAQSLGTSSLVKLAANWKLLDAQFRGILAPPLKAAEREGKAVKANPFAKLDPSGLLLEAVDAGIQMGVETLPTPEAREAGVDLQGARKIAYQTLNRDLVKQSLASLDESREALAMLVEHPKHLMGQTGAAVRDALDGRTMKQLFGLDKRQARTLVRELGDLANQGAGRRELRRYAIRRFKQMLKQRIDRIAGTLANEAMNAGQAAAWKQAKLEGVLKPGYVKEWIARVLPCPRCLAFDGKRVPLDKPFVSDRGEVADKPEIHQNGRCRMRLVKPRSVRGRTERSRRLRRSA